VLGETGVAATSYRTLKRRPSSMPNRRGDKPLPRMVEAFEGNKAETLTPHRRHVGQEGSYPPIGRCGGVPGVVSGVPELSCTSSSPAFRATVRPVLEN
jgi:hypothetical protein